MRELEENMANNHKKDNVLTPDEYKRMKVVHQQTKRGKKKRRKK